MMVLTATEQFEKADELLESMSRCHASQPGSRALAYNTIGIPVCQAIMAHRKKDYASVLTLLGRTRHHLNLMGASHAQRDVFYHLMAHAAVQQNQNDLYTIFLKDIERLGFCDVPKRAAYQLKT